MTARRRITAAITGTILVLAVTGCAAAEEQQSILNPAGSHAEAVHSLWIWLLVIGAVVWVLVIALLIVAVLRRRRADAGDPTVEGSEGRRASMSGRPVAAVAVAGALIPGIIIAGVAGLSIVVQRDIDAAGQDARPLVEVVGHQFWWEVNYPGEGVVSANEIHIPIGERVRIDVSAQDVIHSFWVPELGGKIDMIPGRSNSIWLEADEPGVYWGQCAEYCGIQHARMRIVVVAHAEPEFDAWLDAQRTLPQAEPTPLPGEDPLVVRGREVFLSSSCVYCHTVAGTAAAGQVAPDLTHLASRLTLASGMLPNDSASLSAWILDPQGIKPGSLMPGTEIEDPDDLAALVAYLESLE